VVFDIIFAVLLLYAVITGVRKGLVVQLVELLAVLLGVYIAYKFSYVLAMGVQKLHFNPSAVSTISFILTFILVVIAMRALGKLIHRLLQITLLGWLNRLLGAVFASLKILFLTSVALLILDMVNRQIHIIPNEQIESSKLYHPISTFAPTVFKYLDINKLIDTAKDIDTKISNTIEV
jgi:membrane protein required for colicin V production